MWQERGEAPFNDITNRQGDEIQKLSVIQTLPSLLAGDPQSCIQRLIPKMQQTLPNASTEFHVAASSTFKTILEQKLVSHSTFTQTFLQSILSSLDSRDPVVAHAWLETLVDVIELLPTDVIRREILPVAINKGQLSQSINSRIMCCKLIGKICTRFDSQLIKKEVLPTVHSLCQDVNSDVRACICLQLRFVAERLSADSIKSSLLSSIVELASDEESIVRHASVQTIVYLLPHLQTDVIKNTISPLIKKCCDSALKSDDIVTCIVAQEFGRLALGLEKCITLQEKIWIMRYFQQLSQLGISLNKNDHPKQEFIFSNNSLINDRHVECRRHCAYNIPAMFLFASSTTEDVDELLPTFTALAGDPFYLVRRTIASGIHEVAKILGPKNNLIKNEVVKLLKDDNEEVLQGLVPHMARTLELFVQSQIIGTGQIDFSVMDFGRALLKCEGEIFNTNDWRLSTALFEQLEILPKCFPSDYIYTYFIPIAMNRALNARPNPLKLAAGRTLLVFIRYNMKAMQRTELRNRLYTEFARNPSSYVRMLFIRMMIEAISIFSSMYFKEYFFSIVLTLTEDPIANIRLKVVTLLPSLKSYLRLPSDKKLLSLFESSLRNLMNNEKDRDVIFALTNVIQKLDEIDVKHEGQPTPSKMNKQDSEDLRKYEEEKKLLAAITGKLSTMITGQATTSAIKKSVPVGRMSDSNSRSSSQNSLGSEGPSRAPTLMTQRARQATVPALLPETSSKPSRHPSISRNFDMTKASTSSNNLSSSWARLTSNSMLLTHLWEAIDHPSTNTVSNSSNDIDLLLNKDYTSDFRCDCCDSPNFDYPSRSRLTSPCQLDFKSLDVSCFCHNESAKSNHFPRKYDHFETSVLTSPLTLTHSEDDKHEYLHNFFLPRGNLLNDSKSPNITALRALTNAAHYNSCWAFSSMPEIPVTLLDDEFLVDTGVRIPAQLSSSQSTSKIPNLQDIIYRNTRIDSDKMKRNSTNLDKGKAKIPISGKSNRLSMNFEDQRHHRTKNHFDDQQFRKDDLKTKRYALQRGKGALSFDSSTHGKLSEDRGKRSSSVSDRDRSRSSQSRGVIDRSKRHSANYSVKPVETRDAKQKFKRHSLELTDYTPVERGNRLRRNFALDVNHNQGSSKIPLRNSVASGSRTAPTTRASSPIRLTPQISLEKSCEGISDYSTERHSNRFSSSDEEVDKLCIRFAYVDSSYIRDESPKSRTSKLPVWVPRKKS